MIRPTSERDKDRLAVGEECWLLHGTLLYEVTITEVCSHLVGEPGEFTMYRVDAGVPYYHIKEAAQHRSNLFRRPSEVEELRDQINSDITALNYLLNDLEEL